MRMHDQYRNIELNTAMNFFLCLMNGTNKANPNHRVAGLFPVQTEVPFAFKILMQAGGIPFVQLAWKFKIGKNFGQSAQLRNAKRALDRIHVEVIKWTIDPKCFA